LKKIISLFKRDYENNSRLVYNEIVEGAEWVIAGEGIATRKFDGTCCLIHEGKLYKRYDCKNGKTPPDGFIPSQEPDPITGHFPGWILCDEGNNDDRWRFEALSNLKNIVERAMKSGISIHEAVDDKDGTYELCGPRINKNPEKFKEHIFILHGNVKYFDCPRTFEGLKEWFKGKDIEGIVWHHEDGRMVKIKKKDFGLKRDD
jgi:hypothetical protein